MYDEVKIMICNSCGRNNQNEDANFCEYCGVSLQESNLQESNVQEIKPTYNYSYKNETDNTSTATPPPMTTQAIDISENKKPVSFLNWLGTYSIMLIPILGGLVFLIMLIIWSFSDSTPESKKNWARATLVYMIIMIVLAMLLILAAVLMFRNPIFQDIFNEEMNQYNDIFGEFNY